MTPLSTNIIYTQCIMCGGYRVTAESCVTVTAPSRPHCYTITVLHFTCDTITHYTLQHYTLHSTFALPPGCCCEGPHTRGSYTRYLDTQPLLFGR